MLLLTEGLGDYLKDKNVFVDTDFLSDLFHSKELLKNFFDFYPLTTPLLVDKFTKLEFLRDVYYPKQSDLRESFLQTSFNVIPIHQQILYQLLEKALLLSKIYSSYFKGKPCWSTVDLLIASKVIIYGHNSVLITGNRKDYLYPIFVSKGSLIFESETGNFSQSYFILEPDPAVFNQKEIELLTLTSKYKDELEQSKQLDLDKISF